MKGTVTWKYQLVTEINDCTDYYGGEKDAAPFDG